MFYGVSSYGRIPYGAVPVTEVGSLLSISVSEVISVTDTTKKIIGKHFTEVLSVTDTLSKIRLILRSFSETITVTDSVLRVISKAFSEVITVTDRFFPPWHNVIRPIVGLFTASVTPETPAYDTSVQPQADIWTDVDRIGDALKINATDFLLINDDGDVLNISSVSPGKPETIYSLGTEIDRQRDVLKINGTDFLIINDDGDTLAINSDDVLYEASLPSAPVYSEVSQVTAPLYGTRVLPVAHTYTEPAAVTPSWDTVPGAETYLLIGSDSFLLINSTDRLILMRAEDSSYENVYDDVALPSAPSYTQSIKTNFNGE